MIQLTPQTRIMIAVEPVDFRKGIDGLCGICRRTLQTDPFSGAIFVFGNRVRSAIKILLYDGQGFWLCQKRLSLGRFQWWPGEKDKALTPVAVHELQLLIWNGNPEWARVMPPWKKLVPIGDEQTS